MADRFPTSISSPLDLVEKEINESFDALINAMNMRRQDVLTELKEKHQIMNTEQTSRREKVDQLKTSILSIEKNLVHDELRETQQHFLQTLQSQLVELVTSSKEDIFSFSSCNKQSLEETISKFGCIIVTSLVPMNITQNEDDLKLVQDEPNLAMENYVPSANNKTLEGGDTNLSPYKPQCNEELISNNVRRLDIIPQKDNILFIPEELPKCNHSVERDINKIYQEINISLNDRIPENRINECIQDNETRNQVKRTEIVSKSILSELADSVYQIPNSNDLIYPGVEHGMVASKVVLITFYSTIPNALYVQTKAITIKIGHVFFGNWKFNIMLFNSISTKTVDGEVYHLLRSYLAVPIECFDRNTLIFPYKYCLYMKGNREYIWEHLYRSANNYNIIYNRYFELTIETFNQEEGCTAEVFDLLILPPEGRLSNMVASFWIGFDEKLKSVPYRSYLTFHLCLPYFAGIGEPLVGRCANIDNFIKSFKTLLTRLANPKIVEKNAIQGPYKWDSSTHSKVQQLVSAWIKYIIRYKPKYNSLSFDEYKNNIAKCHIIALLCMQYSIESKDIISEWIEIIFNCFEFAFKANFFGLELLSNLQDSLSELKNSYDWILFHLAYERYRLTKYLSAIPFYHLLFDFQKSFHVCRTNHNYSNPAILGLPTNCGITIFQHVAIDQFVSLWEQYSAIDPLLVFTFVGSANLTEKFVRDFSTLNNIPLIVYIIVILFRINKYTSSNHVAYVSAEVRFAIYEEIILKVSLDLTTPTGKVISIPDLLELIAATFILLSNLTLNDTADLELEWILRLVQQQLLLIEKLDNNYFEHSDTYGEHFLNSEKLFHLVDKVMCFLYPRDIDLQYSKSTTEFQLWNYLIILEFPEAYGWKKIVEAGLALRLSSLDFAAFQILLLRIIDKDGKYDDRLKCIFSENMNNCVKHYKGRN